jgi:hypothetical protein
VLLEESLFAQVGRLLGLTLLCGMRAHKHLQIYKMNVIVLAGAIFNHQTLCYARFSDFASSSIPQMLLSVLGSMSTSPTRQLGPIVDFR